MEFFWILLQISIGYNLVLPGILFVFSLFKRRSSRVHCNRRNDYAIIVTAYEQTNMLDSVLESLSRLNYDLYHVYVVADNCDISDLNHKSPKVTILRPSSVLASNVKSHFYAISHFVRAHNILTIIDSDNTVHSDYLNQLDRYFSRGFNAVQGTRKPKHLTTAISRLDAARDYYYHFYDCEVIFKLGSSSTLSGSGMAFRTELYKEWLKGFDMAGAGFDKALQAKIVRSGHRIAFSNDAIVYDEKTRFGNQLVDQRSRWLSSWFKYFSKGFAVLYAGCKKRSVNQLLFGLILLRPPLFISLILAGTCLLVTAFSNSFYFLCWISTFVIFVLGFILALNKQKAPKEVYEALLSVPLFIGYQLISLYYSPIANKRSIATKHYK